MRKVLIVDDALFMRKSLKTVVEKSGCEVIGEATNGFEAFKLYKELKPDLITMDLTMPQMDGLEALKLIRSFDRNAKIIVISAMGQEIMIREAIVAGAIAFIVKPFKDSDIKQVIRAV